MTPLPNAIAEDHYARHERDEPAAAERCLCRGAVPSPSRAALWTEVRSSSEKDRYIPFATEIRRNMMPAIQSHRKLAALLFEDYFSISGALMKARAPMKKFQSMALES